MPPQKRSIRDFFAPVQNDSRAGQSSTARPSGTPELLLLLPRLPRTSNSLDYAAPKATLSFQARPSTGHVQNNTRAPSRSPSPSPPSPAIGDAIFVNTARTSLAEN